MSNDHYSLTTHSNQDLLLILLSLHFSNLIINNLIACLNQILRINRNHRYHLLFILFLVMNACFLDLSTRVTAVI